MAQHSNLLLWLALWLAAAVVIIAIHWRREKLHVVGLTFAYLINLWLIHWVGATVYLSEGTRRFDPALVEAGVKESLWAIVAFGIGSGLLAPLISRFRTKRVGPRFHIRPDRRLATIYLLLGAISYMLFRGFLSNVPTGTALIAVGQQLFVVGLCLMLWTDWQAKSYGRFVAWILIACCIPFLTVLSQGFIGYGSAALIVVLVFVSMFLRPRRTVVAVSLLGMYLGLSIFVSYAQAREGIREVVWGGRPLSDRVEAVYAATIGMEWFDPADPVHLDQLDNRLNQSHLLGAAVVRLHATGDFAQGSTIWDSLLSLVPRALWPEKPIFAGSGDLVTRYTGITFSGNTSVGIGHVMELYVNFGTPGVAVGFLILGVILTSIDKVAARRLKEGEWHSFALFCLVGISFLQVGGSFVELMSSAGASLLMAVVIGHYLYPLRVRRALGRREVGDGYAFGYQGW